MTRSTQFGTQMHKGGLKAQHSRVGHRVPSILGVHGLAGSESARNSSGTSRPLGLIFQQCARIELAFAAETRRDDAAARSRPGRLPRSPPGARRQPSQSVDAPAPARTCRTSCGRSTADRTPRRLAQHAGLPAAGRPRGLATGLRWQHTRRGSSY